MYQKDMICIRNHTIQIETVGQLFDFIGQRLGNTDRKSAGVLIGEKLGVSPQAVSNMRTQNHVPHRHWSSLIGLLESVGEDISWRDLESIQRSAA